MARTWDSLTDALRTKLVETGWTYDQMADQTGIWKASIYFFVQGQQSLRLDKADQLLRFFNLQVVEQTQAKRRRK